MSAMSWHCEEQIAKGISRISGAMGGSVGSRVGEVTGEAVPDLECFLPFLLDFLPDFDAFIPFLLDFLSSFGPFLPFLPDFLPSFDFLTPFLLDFVLLLLLLYEFVCFELLLLLLLFLPLALLELFPPFLKSRWVIEASTEDITRIERTTSIKNRMLEILMVLCFFLFECKTIKILYDFKISKDMRKTRVIVREKIQLHALLYDNTACKNFASS